MDLMMRRERIRRVLAEIFDEMLRLLDLEGNNTKRYIQLCKRYDDVIKMEEAVMEKMGICMDCPCALRDADLSCELCTGWTKRGKQVRPGNGAKCGLKDLPACNREEMQIMRELLTGGGQCG